MILKRFVRFRPQGTPPRSIRSIVPQELVFIKTYPFGMIKLIQQIFYLQIFIPFEKY